MGKRVGYGANNEYQKQIRQDAVDAIIEALEFGYEGDIYDLHNDLFNTDYYIVGTYEAEQFLNGYGFFDAIREIKEYDHSYDYVSLNMIENAEKMANLLYYIIGYEIFSIIQDEFPDLEEFGEDVNSEIIEFLKNLEF